MYPLHVNERWFEDYWYGGHPVTKRRPFVKRRGRIAACLIVALGGAVLLMQSAGNDRMSDSHPNPHFRLM
jgi:hypothetical protein